MRKVIALFLMSFLIISACSESEKRNRNKKEKGIPGYTIGINLPLTGNGSYFAAEFKKGLDLTFEFFNKPSGKIFINPVYEDNKMNPRDAVSITKKFLEIDNVDLIISGYTPIIQATIGLADQANVPMLISISSAEKIAAPYKWAFRDFELESNIMPMLASYTYSVLGLKRGSSLVVNDDMGYDAVEFFSEKFAKEGGDMLEGEVFESSEMDMRNKITRVMDGNPDFIIVVGRGSAMINALRQIRELNSDIPIISNNTVDIPMVWKALGDHGNNIWFSRPFADINSKMYLKSNERFKTKYGRDMNWLNIYGISIASYLVRGLKVSSGDPVKMLEFLQTLNIESIRGTLFMNKDADVVMPHTVYQRKNGQSIPVGEGVFLEKPE